MRDGGNDDSAFHDLVLSTHNADPALRGSRERNDQRIKGCQRMMMKLHPLAAFYPLEIFLLF
jgi:hypothetical protein